MRDAEQSGTGVAVPDRGDPHREALFIGGAWRAPIEGGQPTEVINAADGTVLARVPAGSARDVDAAIEAARRTAAEWSRTDPEERAALLEAVRDELASRQAETAELISLEVGTPRTSSERVQVGLPLLTLQGFADAARELEWRTAIANSTVLREPAGVVGAITPWNYPLHQIAAKVAPALAAGCTVVLKPSEIAPLNAFILAEVVHAAGLPKGVFNLVTGYGPVVGEAIARHPGVDMVSFTGSVRAGKRVAELGAQHVKRVTLELGGKSAAIVLDDADLAQAVKGTVNA